MKIFDSVPMSRPDTNLFDLSHERKFSCKMGDLVPVLVQEVLPGDSFRHDSEIFMRLAPMVAPVMHRVDVFTHYFAVPYRLVWDESEQFFTGGEDGAAAPMPPYFNMNDDLKESGAFVAGSLSDYLGLPTFEIGSPAITITAGVSALPFRAMQLIYNEYYRDQNLTDPIVVSKASGLQTFDAGTEFADFFYLKKRCWEKDYFTSALPWAQRGAEILIPIEGEGDVTYKNISTIHKSDGSPADADKLVGTSGAFGAMDVGKNTNITGGTPGRIENIDDVTFENTSVTINDLRRSIALQKWLETSARGGARYTETIRAHFGVTSPDARLQRPEYLGGGKQPVTISEVLSTAASPDGEGNPQGNMAGHGVSVGNSNRWSYKATEHMYIIGVMSVLPRTAYQQGIDRMWTRFNKFDHAWPKLANIGEQEVYNYELYYDGVTGGHTSTFGYQSRYSEYKYKRSSVHGEFRNSLDYWHMGRKFISQPLLNTEFVSADPTTRIFAVEDATEQLYVQMHTSLKVKRALPYYGVPAI